MDYTCSSIAKKDKHSSVAYGSQRKNDTNVQNKLFIMPWVYFYQILYFKQNPML